MNVIYEPMRLRIFWLQVLIRRWSRQIEIHLLIEQEFSEIKNGWFVEGAVKIDYILLDKNWCVGEAEGNFLMNRKCIWF